MQKPKLSEVAPGYYLAPAVFDQRMFSAFVSRPAANPVFSYQTKKYQDGNYTAYRYGLPDSDLLVFSESYRKSADVKHKTFNVRDRLKTPFGLVNWLDRPALELMPNHLIIQDSGGFQIAVGREDFISPEDVLNAHKKVDLGVSLDIPLVAFGGAELDKKSLARLCSVTSDTNRFFDKGGYSTYLNVNHGATIRERLSWLGLSRKSNSGGVGLSVGGFRISPKSYLHPKAFTTAARRLIVESGYKYFHFLGATAGWQMMVLAALAEKHKVVITSDSSTWVQLGISAQIVDENFSIQQISPKGGSNAHRYLNCGCFVCKQAKWEYVYSQTPQIALMHNLLMLDKIADRIRRFHADTPGASVSTPLPYIKENLKGLDAYVEGTKAWPEDKPLRSTNAPPSGRLFSSSASAATSRAAEALAIVDKFDSWFSKNT